MTNKEQDLINISVNELIEHDRKNLIYCWIDRLNYALECEDYDEFSLQKELMTDELTYDECEEVLNEVES